MSTAVFRKKAPAVMQLLMDDFDLDKLSAAAILGNLGAESGGFTQMQELRPTVRGSRGGFGWAQWTGPRRRAFEAYCMRNELDPRSDIANYKYLFNELKGPEAQAIIALKNAEGLRAKVIAFERVFERAGIKHYDSRLRWADRALAAYEAAGSDIPTLTDEGEGEVEPKRRTHQDRSHTSRQSPSGYRGVTKDTMRLNEQLTESDWKIAQLLLFAKGYYTGEIDGIPGKETLGAIVKAKVDLGIEDHDPKAYTRQLDKALRKKRGGTVSRKRATTTLKELAPRSDTVRKVNEGWFAGGATVLAGLWAAFQGFLADLGLDTTVVGGWLEDIPGWLIGAVVAVLGMVVISLFSGIGRNRLKEYLEGRYTPAPDQKLIDQVEQSTGIDIPDPPDRNDEEERPRKRGGILQDVE